MNTNTKYPFRYYRWLVGVRQELYSLTYRAIDKNGNPYRAHLFGKRTKLCPHAWYRYYEAKIIPFKAVREDLELPWYETKQVRILG